MDRKRIFGLFIILFGVLLLLNALGLTHVGIGDLISSYWPLLIVGNGIFNLVNNPAGRSSALIVLSVGLLLQLKVSGHFDIFEIQLLWPIVLIFIGFRIIFKKENYEDQDTIEVLKD